MYELMESWLWYDRVIAGAIIASIIFGPIYITRQLERVIKLLVEIRNDQQRGLDS